MKNYLRIFSILFVWSSLLFVSCSDDETILENPPVEDSITEDSEIAILIQRAAIEDRSFDDFIDLADCLSINLPLTISINNVSITINDDNDYQDVIALISKFNNKYDIQIEFPIVITLSDYTQVVINSEEELIPYVAACQEMDNDIPCIEFVFPISFSVYDTEFELIDTIEINSNEELYFFIENIQAGTLVSLNFPVEMELQNGQIIEVNNNTELQEAIEAAELECNMMSQTEFGCYDFIIVEQGCDDDDDGEATFVLNIINAPENQQECVELLPFSLTMHLTLEDAINGVPAPGILFEEPVELISQTLYARYERIATGEFEIQALELEVEACDGMAEFSCFENQDYQAYTCINSYIEIAIFNLTFFELTCEDDQEFTYTYHYNEEQAEANIDVIENPSNFEYLPAAVGNIIYVRVTSNENPQLYGVYTISLNVGNCNDQLCTEDQLIDYLEQCVWVTNGNGDSFTLEFAGGNVVAFLNGNSQEVPMEIGSNILPSTLQEFPFITFELFTGIFTVLNNTYEVGFCSPEFIAIQAIDVNMPTPFNGLERDCTDCDNPGTIVNDLIIYIPFANSQTKELITNQILNAPIDYVTDRDGNNGCAALFNGGPSSVIIPVTDSNQLLSTDNMTVSLWFQMNNTQAGDLEYMFKKGAPDNSGFQIGVYDLNTPLAISHNPLYNLWDNDWNQEVDVEWTNTDWHHLVITRDANNFAQLWRDGILRNESLGMDIGMEAMLQYELGENFTGALDDLRVYKRVLNPNEITTLYQLPADCYDCLE